MYRTKTPTSYISPDIFFFIYMEAPILFISKTKKKIFLDYILVYCTLSSVLFLFCWYNWKWQTIFTKVCFRLTLMTFNKVYS